MIFTIPQKLSNLATSQLINKAKDAELSIDLLIAQENFKPVWDNIEIDPDFSEYDDLQRAELFRLSGFFLSQYGKSKNLRHYQERAKNILTNAIELFLKCDLKDRALEVNVVLGLCYFYEGAINESETILKQTTLEFKDNQLHPVYLRACNNWLLVLHWKREFPEALRIINEIEIPVEFCNDKRLMYMFHTQTGMIYRGIKKYDTAIYHYNKAIEVGREIKNWGSVARNHNNLAFLYKSTRNFEKAHQHIEIAIRTIKENHHEGWLPHFIDTKALIYFAENKFANSLQTINEAIELFQQGEDYAALVDAMWNKVRCYLSLHQKEEAILLFAQLAQTAQIQIGEVAVKKYTKLFTDIIYVKQDDSLENEVIRFKKLEIVNALRLTDYNIDEASIELGFSSANKLIKVLNTEFPELYDELGIQQRTKQAKIKNIKKVANKSVEKINPPAPKLINQLQLRNIQLEFDAALNIRSAANIKTFYCSTEKMSEVFDVSFDAILAVSPINQVIANDVILIRKFSTNNFSLARISHDENFDVPYLIENEAPLTFDEVEIIGKVAGFCSFEEADREKLFFKPLQK